MPHLIAVDWGTSSLRGALLDEAGQVLEEKSAPLGILNVPNGDFAGVFDSQFSDWMKPAGTLCLISGMAGSRQGWVEAPYVACPAGLGRAGAAPALDRAAIASPSFPASATTQGDVPDVMRGEEVQIFGAMRLAGLADGLFVLPGTHSKWATVRDGRVTGFRTFMTGEVYGLFGQHSILARTLDADAPLDEAAFRRGVARAGNGEGLLHNAFGVRALGLFGRLSPAESASYLSGLLIGEELGRQTLPSGGEVIVIGASALVARYASGPRREGSEGAHVRRRSHVGRPEGFRHDAPTSSGGDARAAADRHPARAEAHRGGRDRRRARRSGLSPDRSAAQLAAAVRQHRPLAQAPSAGAGRRRHGADALPRRATWPQAGGELVVAPNFDAMSSPRRCGSAWRACPAS